MWHYIAVCDFRPGDIFIGQSRSRCFCLEPEPEPDSHSPGSAALVSRHGYITSQSPMLDLCFFTLKKVLCYYYDLNNILLYIIMCTLTLTCLISVPARLGNVTWFASRHGDENACRMPKLWRRHFYLDGQKCRSAHYYVQNKKIEASVMAIW